MAIVTRGKKSAEAKNVISLIMNKKYPPAPLEMGKDAIALWNNIAESLPADFFRAGDLPLLEAYVVSATRKRWVDSMVLDVGMILNDQTPHPGLKISRDEATLMASLATKLRLCQSSRTRPESASLNIINHAGNGKKPWE